ncbi:hypothetical protein SMSP2_01443 [Limihaloglobus sulfuriphilus]|uniref:Thioredoxin domain-containing protein n=2 Tax=Limihaloglobus sulfuriphilus TaxID=1851148 RepID=A0A1Q2MEK0_9BACT|nr:hypothetical protein SMSP2_01443 [Limihaloglobus sulfuriphilus]
MLYAGVLPAYFLIFAVCGVFGADIDFSLIDGQSVARCRIVYKDLSFEANVVLDAGQSGSVFLHENTGKMLEFASGDTLSMEFAGGAVLSNLKTTPMGLEFLEDLTKDFASELNEIPAVAMLGIDAFSGHTFTIDQARGKISLSNDPLTLEPQEPNVFAFNFERGRYGLVLNLKGPDGFDIKAGISTRRRETLIDTIAAELASDLDNNLGDISLGGITINDYTPLRATELSGGNPDMPDIILGNVFFESFAFSVDPVNDIIHFRQKIKTARSFPEQAFFDAVRDEDPDAIEEFINDSGRDNFYYQEAAASLAQMRLSQEPFDKSAWLRAVEHTVKAAQIERKSQVLINHCQSLRNSGKDPELVLVRQLLEQAKEWADDDINSRAPFEIQAQLGLAALELGEITQARRHMLSAVFGLPKEPRFNLWMGMVYEKMDKNLRAWSRYIISAMADDPPPEATPALDRLNNNIEFRKEFGMRDARELLEGHIPDFHPENRAQQRPAITTLEFFNSVDNPDCGAIALAVDGIGEYFSDYNVQVVKYHLSRPTGDPMETRISVTRADYYGVKTTPALFIDGKRVDLRGFKGMMPQDVFNGLLEGIENQDPAKRELMTNTTRKDGQIEVEFQPLVEGLEYQSAVLLVEGDVMSAGASGLWMYRNVVRHGIQSLFDEEKVTYTIPDVEALWEDIDTTIGQIEEKYSTSFITRPWYVDPDRCRIVVLIQEKESKRIVLSFEKAFEE